MAVPRNVLVLDDDQSVCLMVEHLLYNFAVPKVTCFQSSVEALAAAEHQDFDFFILDWKLPEISGAAVFNRLRDSEKYCDVPIIVSSAFLEKPDLALLGEYLLTGVLEKPLQKSVFQRTVETLYAESLWLEEKKDTLTDIFAKMEGGHFDDTVVALEKLLDSAPHPLPIGCAAARILINSKHIEQAEHLLIQLLKKEPETILPLHLLGKVKILQKKYVEAQRILKNAYTRSPKNLERLNLIGTAAMHNLDYAEADTFFKKALDIDKSSSEAQAGAKLVKNIFDYIADERNTHEESLASLLNSIGIAHIRSRKYAQGIEFYLAAIPHLGDTKLEARLQFNIGLAYMRWNKNKAAARHLQEAKALDPSFEKIHSLEQRIASAVKLEEKLKPMPKEKPSTPPTKTTHSASKRDIETLKSAPTEPTPPVTAPIPEATVPTSPAPEPQGLPLEEMISDTKAPPKK